MKSIRLQPCVAALALVLAPAFCGGLLAASRLLPFQGRLTTANGSPLADGARVVQFKIYDAPVGGRAMWNGEVQNLSVNGGLVNTLLGTKASLEGVDFNQDLYLEVTVDANGDGQITLADPPLLPRQSILPAVFARESANSQRLGGYDWSALFGTNNPAEGTILDSKIRDGGITTAKIPNGAVTRPKLDTSGAQAGQSLMYNGTDVVWSQVNALNADNAANAANANLLDGYDWASLFNNANPQTGIFSAAGVTSRGDLNVAGQSVFSGRVYLNGLSTTIQGTLLAPTVGLNMYFNDWSIYFRANGDNNHFLRYGNAYGGITGFDGPILGGNGGGVLGAGGSWTLRWNSTGTVQVRGTISSGSDRNIKENFADVNAADVLDKVLALPISQWNYKDDPAARHIGPVAQDFRAAFGLGSDDKSIATVDADGIALTAIQALNKKLQARDDSLRNLIQAQQEQIETLKAELAALKPTRQ